MHTIVRIGLRVVWGALWLLGGAYIASMWWQTSGSAMGGDNASTLIALGRIAGLMSGYLILWQLVFMSRLSVLERAFGHNLLAQVHRWNGTGGLWLLLAHVACLLVGYAAQNNTSLIAQFVDFQVEWTDVLFASIGFGLLLAVGAMSVVIVRRRLRYETWYTVHTATYLAIALAVSHQLSVGSDLLADTTFQAFWIMLYVFAFGAILLFRVGSPIYLWHRHRFVVKRVHTEAPGVVSVYVSGNNMERFRYTAGQYAIWRFLTPDLWLQAHPFSLSLAPGGKELRLTVKAVGDFTRQVPGIQPGSPVIIDGPHGDFVLPQPTRQPLLFIAGGIGITPLRAMLEAMPKGNAAPVLVYAVRTAADLALRRELEALIAARDGQVHYVLSEELQPGFYHGVLDDKLLGRLVPDVKSRQVFLCGPPPMMRAVRGALRQLGVPARHIYSERFAFLGGYKTERR